MARKKERDGLYLRGEVWWLRRDPLTLKPISTRCRDLEAAELYRAKRERVAADPAHAAAASETITSACRRMIEERRSHRKPTGYYEQKLGHWPRVFGDDLPLSELGPAAFDRYLRVRRGEGVTDHTIGKEVRCMLTVLKASKRLGLYQYDLAVLRPPDLSSSYVARTRALAPAEIVALLAQLEERRRAFVALILGLGLRRGELLALKPEHVDVVSWVVRVPGTKTELSRREVPVLAPFRALVQAAAASLPVDPWGNYLRDLRVACKHAGIAPCTANDLRRTHATLLRQAGVDRDVVRRLLGHSPKSSMLEQVYDQPTPAALASRAASQGDFDTLTLQLEGSDEKSRRAREDSNLGPTAPEAVAGGAASASPLTVPHTWRRGRRRKPTWSGTRTLQQIDADLKADAAERTRWLAAAVELGIDVGQGLALARGLEAALRGDGAGMDEAVRAAAFAEMGSR
jgi:integrase